MQDLWTYDMPWHNVVAKHDTLGLPILCWEPV